MATTRSLWRDGDARHWPIVRLASLLAWPDVDHGYHLLEGYLGKGHYGWCGIYVWREGSPSDKKEVFQDAEAHNASLLARMRPGLEDSFIMEQSLVDARKGFATEPMSWDELQAYVAGQQFRLIRRFVITQSSGKKRIIDDAADGGQSDSSTDENALQFCSAV